MTREAVGLHNGAVVGLVGFAELWGHGGLVVEVGQAAVRVSSNMYIFTNRIISKSAKKVNRKGKIVFPGLNIIIMLRTG